MCTNHFEDFPSSVSQKRHVSLLIIYVDNDEKISE